MTEIAAPTALHPDEGGAVASDQLLEDQDLTPVEDLCEDLLRDLPDDMVPPPEGDERRPFYVHDAASADWAANKFLTLQAEAERYEVQMKRVLAQKKANAERFARRFLPQLQEFLDANMPAGKSRFMDLDAARIGLRKQPARAKVVSEATVIGFICDGGYVADLVSPESGGTLADALVFMRGRPGFGPLIAQMEEIQEAEGDDVALELLRGMLATDAARFVTEQTVKKLDGDGLRRHAVATGETMPGLELTPEHDTFYIKAP